MRKRLDAVARMLLQTLAALGFRSPLARRGRREAVALVAKKVGYELGVKFSEEDIDDVILRAKGRQLPLALHSEEDVLSGRVPIGAVGGHIGRSRDGVVLWGQRDGKMVPLDLES